MGSDRAKLFTRCCYAAVSIVALSVMFWIAWCLFGLTAVPVAEPQRRALVHYSPTPSPPTEETSASNAISKLPTTSSLAKELAKGDFSPRDKNHSSNAERAGDLKTVRIPTAAPKKGPASVDSEEVLQTRRVSSSALENRSEEKASSVSGPQHEIAPTRTYAQPETESRVYASRDETVPPKRDDVVQSSRRVGDDDPIVDRVPEFVKGETRRRVVSRPGYDEDEDRGSKGRYGSAVDRGRESDERYSKGDTRVYPDDSKFKEDRIRKGDEDEDDRYVYRDERPRPAEDVADDGKRLRDEERYKMRNDDRYRDRNDERYRDRDDDKLRDRDVDRYRDRDDERYRYRDDERYRYRDDERYRDRDDERYKDRDVDRYRDRDEDKLKDRDVDRYRDRDSDKLRDRDVDRYRDRDSDKVRDRDVDRYRDRDDDKLRDRDVDRYRDRDDDKLRDRDVDRYKDRDDDKLRDRDVDRYKDRDDDKLRDRDVDRYKDRDDDKLRDRVVDRYRDRDGDKLRDRDVDRYRVRDSDKLRDRDVDRYRDRDDDKMRDRDVDRYRGRDDDKLRDRDVDRYRDRGDDRYEDRIDDKYRDRDDDRYRDRDDDRYRDRDDDRYRPRYRDGVDDKYGYRGSERYGPRDDDDEYGEKRYPIREDDRPRSRPRVVDDDNRDRDEKREYRPPSSVSASRTSEDIPLPKNAAVGVRKPTTSSRYESTLRTEETVTDYDIPLRPYDEEEDRDRKRSRDDEERRPFVLGISPTRTRDESYSSRPSRSRGYDDDKRTDYMSRPRDEDRTVIEGSRRSSSEKEATRLYTDDRDRSRPVESTKPTSDRRDEVVLDRRSYASDEEYRKGSRRDDDDRRQIGDVRRRYEDEDDGYSRRRDRIDEDDDYMERGRRRDRYSDRYDDRPLPPRPVRRYLDEDETPPKRDPDRVVRIDDSRYVDRGSSRPVSSIRDEERSYSRDDNYRPSRTYDDEDPSENGRRSRRPAGTREPPFFLSTMSPRDPGDSVAREKRYQDREPAVRPLSAKDVIEAANRQSDTSESNVRKVFYPVFDPRLSNLTSPEIIQPSERRGTTITLRRRRRNA